MLFSPHRNKVRRCCLWDSLDLITTGLSKGNYLEFLATATLSAASVQAWGEASEHYYIAFLLMSIRVCHVFYIFTGNLLLSSTVSKDGCGFITGAIPAIKNMKVLYHLATQLLWALSLHTCSVYTLCILVDYGQPPGFRLLPFSLAVV